MVPECLAIVRCVPYTADVALHMGKALFFHVPKTGGSWVRSVVKRLKIPTSESRCAACGWKSSDAHVHWCCFHAASKDIDPAIAAAPIFRFAFIRHPVTFYQSFWSYKMKQGWQPDLPFDCAVGRPVFSDFVHAVLDRYRDKKGGWLTMISRRFLGPEEAPIVDFVGKQENLALDLLWALRTAGFTVDANIVLNAARENETSILPEWKEKCAYTPELLEAVRTAEAEVIRRFGYH